MSLILPRIIILRNQEFLRKTTNFLQRSENFRNFASKKTKRPKKSQRNLDQPPPCGMESCNEPKKSIWNLFCGKNKRKHQKKSSTSPYVTSKPISDEEVCQDMSNLKNFGGAVYKTCGEAYLVQKPGVKNLEIDIAAETKILDEMTKDPSLKGQVDPMPPFESVEKRLVDLSERKLHPLYKYLMSIPKKPAQNLDPLKNPYKSRSGAILPDDIPDRLGIDKEIFEKKNLNCEFKRIEPPQPLLAQIVEMARNQKPTMAPPKPKKSREVSKSKK